MKKLIFLGFSLMLLVSCSSNKVYHNNLQENVFYGVAGDEDFAIDIAYIGALGRNFIFECTVKNTTGEYIRVDQEDFVMLVEGREEILPVMVEHQITDLLSEKKKIKKKKKANTLLSILDIGATVFVGAASGASAAETLVYAAEPIFYAADEAAWANRNMNSVEDEIDYLNNALFDYDLIEDNTSLTRDVIFPISKIKGDVTVLINLDGREYGVDFDRTLFML